MNVKRLKEQAMIRWAALVAAVALLAVGAVPAATAEAQAPNAPGWVLAAVANNYSVVAHWGAVAGATGYDVNYSSDNGASWSSAATNVAGTSYTLYSPTISVSTSYVLAVRAKNSSGDSGWTHSPPTAPHHPDDKHALAPPTPEDPNDENPLAPPVSNTSSNGTSSNEQTPAEGSPQSACPVGYACAIGSTDSGQQQQQSGTTTGSAITAGAVAGRQSSPPAAPASVTLTRADGTLTATWPAVPGADSYHVTYSTDNGASWSLAALTHGSASITIDAADGADYIVGVRARNASGYGGWTNSSPIMLGAPALLGPPAWTTGPGISAIVGPTGSGEKAGPPVSRYANTSGAASYCGSYADYLQPLCLQLFAEPS